MRLQMYAKEDDSLRIICTFVEKFLDIKAFILDLPNLKSELLACICRPSQEQRCLLSVGEILNARQGGQHHYCLIQSDPEFHHRQPFPSLRVNGYPSFFAPMACGRRTLPSLSALTLGRSDVGLRAAKSNAARKSISPSLSSKDLLSSWASTTTTPLRSRNG